MNRDISLNESKYHSRNPVKRYLLNRFLGRIDKEILGTDPEKILDCGCGEGFIAKRLIGLRPDIKYTGVDISAEAVRRAEKKVIGANFIKGSIYKLPFADRTFDTVICLEVLEHLEFPEKGLSELKRVTKKSCIISIPDEPLFSVLSLLSGMYLRRFGRHPEHINAWNGYSFREFVKPGFRKIKFSNSMPWLICVCWV